MRVRVISFGTNWWAACLPRLERSMCFRRRAAWFNSAGLKQGRRLRFCWVFSRPDSLQSHQRIQPGVSSALRGKSFHCSGQTFCADGRIFVFTLRPEMPYPIASWSQSITNARADFVCISCMDIRWSPAHLSQSAWEALRSNGAVDLQGLDRYRSWAMGCRRGLRSLCLTLHARRTVMRYYKGYIAISDERDIPALLHIRNARAVTFDSTVRPFGVRQS